LEDIDLIDVDIICKFLKINKGGVGGKSRD
jgi:hypothetical protein